MTASQTHIVFLCLKEQKTNGDLRQFALRGLFTVSVNDKWRKIACQNVVAALAVRVHISSHLWPTQLCCQNTIEFAFIGKKMKIEGSNHWTWRKLLSNCSSRADNPCLPTQVFSLFWKVCYNRLSSSGLLGHFQPRSQWVLQQFVSFIQSFLKRENHNECSSEHKESELWY